MRDLVISERAERDLREIWRYSFDNWGEDQADRYLDGLDNRMRKCCSEPEHGKRRDFERPGYRSMRAGQHLIFYTFTEHEVLIQRVLHGSMDPGLHL